MSKCNLVLVSLMLLGTQFFSTTINTGAWNFCCGSRQRPSRVRAWAHEHQNVIANAAGVLVTVSATSLVINRVNRAMDDKTPTIKVNVWASIVRPAICAGTAVKLVLMADKISCDRARSEADH